MPCRILILVLLAGALVGVAPAGASASLNLPSKPPQANKIIGGTPDPYNDTGWVAALHMKGIPGVDCGGSLVGRRYVLTAAHCTWNTSRRQWKVRLGSKRWNSGGVVRGVKRIFVYPRFNHRTSYGDISVLRLSAPVYLRPVYLVSSGTSYVTDPPSEAYIAGWGSTISRGYGYPLTLRSAWVSLLPDGDCQGLPDYRGSVMICAGAPDRGTCDGDSGGPLAVWDGSWWELVGVTSYGPCTRNSAYAWVGSPTLHRWLTGS